MDEIVILVSIVNYFSSKAIRALVESFQLVDSGLTTEIVIVDNSCDKAEFERLRSLRQDFQAHFKSIDVLKCECNLGFGRGHNRADELLLSEKGQWAENSVRVVLNPDVTFTSGSLLEFAKDVLESRSTWTPRTQEKGTERGGLARLNLITGKSSIGVSGSTSLPSITYAGGHFLAMRTLDWISLGGFCESYFLYCEEADLEIRARGAGMSRARSSDAVRIAHVGGATTTDPNNHLGITARYHSSRSRVILYRRFSENRMFLGTMVVCRALYSGGLILRLRPSQGVASLKGILSGFRAQDLSS